MNPTTVRTVLLLTFALLLAPFPSLAAPERLTALVIGNSAYVSAPLSNPVNDAETFAVTLQRLGFEVILKKDARLQDMEDSIRDFGDRLRDGGVGLFFYAGHGVQVAGKNYLIPIGADIARETEVKYKAVDADMILDEMGGAGNRMNILILDACRDNPFARSFRSASRGLAIVSAAPRGTFISYSTSPGRVAADGSGRNSPYTEALVAHMITPGLPIEEVFKRVRQDIVARTGGDQIPWELSSLEGQFYFVAPNSEPGALADTPARQEPIVLEKQELALVPRVSASGAQETKRDGRFIAFSDGTVLDTNTRLMWAATDNGAHIKWEDARAYTESYRGGGYTDWRLPTLDELAALYDAAQSRATPCWTSLPIHVATKLIDITCFAPWASDAGRGTWGATAARFNFSFGTASWHGRTEKKEGRALPVRVAE